MERLRTTRDRVLERAGLVEGEVVLDVGCGDGLIGFGALDRGAGEVIFSDVSQDLLDEVRRLAKQLGVSERCQFVRGGADDLSAINSKSIDVITTRSVLIYVEEKTLAFQEFYRILRGGGRVSLSEPINRLNRFRRAYDAGDVQDLEDRVQGVFETLQPLDRDPMLNFDARDLVEFAESAGFERVSMLLEIETKPPEPIDWDTYINVAFNPKIPTIREAMSQTLTPEERVRYEAHMRPLVDAGRGSRRMAASFLRAVKNGSEG